MNEIVLQSNVKCFAISIDSTNDFKWSGDEIVYASRSYKPVNFFPIEVSVSSSSIQILNPENFSHFKIVSNNVLSKDNISIGVYPHHDFPTTHSTIREKNAIKKKSIIFVGLARDCESVVKLNVDLLKQIGSHFKEFKIIVFENDSKDSTNNVLSEINDIILHSVSSLDNRFPERTERLAHLRNLGLQEAIATNFDYYCPVDLDGVLTTTGYEFDVKGFLSSFYYEEFWDAVFPVSDGVYYDLWALRHWELSPDDWMFAESSGTSALGIDIIQSREIFTRQYDLRKMSGWLKVDSAFGGIGVYKMNKLGNAKYIGKENEVIVSEHVPFNLKLSSNRLYLNPRFVTYGYEETKYRTELLKSTLF
jgi:hypothetical protein